MNDAALKELSSVQAFSGSAAQSKWNLCLIKHVDLHEIDRLKTAALRAALFSEKIGLKHSTALRKY